MAEIHIVSALRSKYSELLGLLQKPEKEVEALRAGLAHIEATIRLFKPGWDSATVSGTWPKVPVRWRRQGTGIRTALEIMRQDDRALTAHELALQVMRRNGQPTDDAAAVKAVACSMRG